MVQVLWHTGMRPEEVCIMRAGDLDQSGDVWLYRPNSSKLDHMEGMPEVVRPIGPQAQAIISPYLERDLAAYMFTSREGSGRDRESYRDHYTSETLRSAVHRACDRIYPLPEDLQGKSEKLNEDQKERRRRWWRRHRWNPNQLRHARATMLEKMYDLETARASVGHLYLSTTQIYADRDLKKAIEIARATG